MKKTTKKAARPARKATKKKTTLKAQSRQTGIVHTFENIELWERIAFDFEEKRRSVQQSDLISGLSFSHFLNGQKLTTSPNRLGGTAKRAIRHFGLRRST